MLILLSTSLDFSCGGISVTRKEKVLSVEAGRDFVNKVVPYKKEVIMLILDSLKS